MEHKVFSQFFSILLLFLMLPGTVVLSQGIDWGDAPDPAYPTLAANNGAHHLIIPGMHLGISVDGEPDGQIMTGNATGDDINGADDADGVIFNSWLLPGQNATVIVIASLPGMLNAWIDFNKDGDWADVGEHIFTDAFLNPGHNLLSYPVPAGISTTSLTFARFRYSSAPGLSFLGTAPDGEVEDYMVRMGSPPNGDIIIDPDPTMTLVQNEISMAMIPGANFGPPDLLIAAYNDEPFAGGPGLGISFSMDAGATWTNTHLSYPMNTIAGVPMIDMFDPGITIDDSGHVFVAQVSTDANWWVGPVSGLFVHKSIDGGLSWQPPVTVSIEGPPAGSPDTAYRFNDRDQICTDHFPGSPFYNNIYVSWIQDRGWNQPLPYSDIYCAFSTDGGNHFSPPKRINSWANNMGNMPVPDVASDGSLYIAWIDYNVQTGGQGVIFLDRSTDGGVTWGPDILVDTIDLPPLNLNGNTDTRAKGAAVIKVNPSDPDELYLVYAADPDGAGNDEADIFFIASSDAGVSWTIPYRVNDDATLNDQILPWMSVKPNGIIDICWYDRRNDLSDFDWDVYFTSSTDGGASFAPNVKVNSLMFYPPFVPKTGDAWIGEYMALVTDYYTAYMIHTSSVYDGLGDLIFVTAENPVQLIDWGDAPDAALAYPASGITGSFPSCMAGSNYGQFIRHFTSNMWLGPAFDSEPDGNAGICNPYSFPYDNDECYQDNDAGLAIPMPYTISGPAGQEMVIPCAGNATPLDTICSMVHWGTELDIHVVNNAAAMAYMNVLIDWNQDGWWAYNTATMCNSTVVPEHALVDFIVPAGFNGLLSTLNPPAFKAGPNTGYLWSRFTISDMQAGNDWHGYGGFYDGETEDYLLELVLNTRISGTVPILPGRLKMIPNPAKGFARVEFFNPEAGKTEMIVYNLLGSEEFVIVNNHCPKGRTSMDNIFSFNQLKPGIYILEHRLNNLTIERIKIIIR